jgi:ATP-binding protein involved in chromosome partitioning
MLSTYHQGLEIFIFYHAIAASYTGAVVSTPQAVALADAKKVSMFLGNQCSCLGIIENMAYFTPELPNNKYYIFGQEGAKILPKI